MQSLISSLSAHYHVREEHHGPAVILSTIDGEAYLFNGRLLQYRGVGPFATACQAFKEAQCSDK